MNCINCENLIGFADFGVVKCDRCVKNTLYNFLNYATETKQQLDNSLKYWVERI